MRLPTDRQNQHIVGFVLFIVVISKNKKNIKHQLAYLLKCVAIKTPDTNILLSQQASKL